MRKRNLLTMSFFTLLALFALFAVRVNAMPHVQFPPADAVTATREEVKELEDFYRKIEEALVKKDIEAVMGFYAGDYFHQGITRQQVRGLWTNLFEKFEKLNSTHIFSIINVQGNEAVIGCTGTLFGVPKGSKEGRYSTVDRWVEQNHYLTKKGGNWQIVGGATHWFSGPMVRPNGVLEYQLEFHPLF